MLFLTDNVFTGPGNGGGEASSPTSNVNIGAPVTRNTTLCRHLPHAIAHPGRIWRGGEHSSSELCSGGPSARRNGRPFKGSTAPRAEEPTHGCLLCNAAHDQASRGDRWEMGCTSASSDQVFHAGALQDECMTRPVRAYL